MIEELRRRRGKTKSVTVESQ
jgi:hypothetical protein